MKSEHPNHDLTMPLLEEGLTKLGLGGDDRFYSLLARYVEEIELFNPAYGLVKVQDRRELIVKHIFDSLAPISILRRLLDNIAHNTGAGRQSDEGPNAALTSLVNKTTSVADAGSGAGLPGIPLAICMSDAEFTLIERMGRRAGFLRNTLAVLGLANVRLEETEIEKFALNTAGRGRFDLIVFRAFRPFEPAILKALFALLAPGGSLAAYKGRLKSIEEEMAQVRAAAEKGAGPSVGRWEALPLEVPFLKEERHLLLVKP